MILYTMVPQELIFQSDMKEFDKLFEVTYEGVPLLVEMGESGSCRIMKVLSSDPAHFLNAKFLPGNTIFINRQTNSSD